MELVLYILAVVVEEVVGQHIQYSLGMLGSQ
jgi:hypothetical protein